MSTEPKARPVKVIIANSQTYRDCWLEENGYIVLRQISFNADGTEGEVTKLFRISPEDFSKIKELQGEHNGKDQER